MELPSTSELVRLLAATVATYSAVTHCAAGASPTGRATPAAADGGHAGAALGALRKELRALPLGELRRRASGCGFSEEELDAALESDSPKDALVAMLLAQRSGGGGGGTTPLDALIRSDLRALGMAALTRRAVVEGVEQKVLDEARAAADPKAAVVELVARRLGAGSRSAGDVTTEVEGGAQADGFHGCGVV